MSTLDMPVAVCSRTFSAHETLRRELLEVASDVRFNDDGASLRGAALVDFLRGAERVVVALEPIDAALLDALPDLRAIAKFGVGTDGLDLDLLRTRGVSLGWRPGVNRRAVAELVVSHAIALLRHVPTSSRAVASGEWRRFIGRELGGCTVGILGFGNVGQDVARLLSAFGCRVLAHDIRDRTADATALGVEIVTREALFERSDVLTVHVPLDGTTRNMVDAALLSRLPDGAVLVNLARGGIVDERAVLDALDSGRLAAAAFDVFAVEPPTDLTFARHERVLATPHIGGSSREGILAMGRAAIAGLLDPRPIDTIDFHEIR